MDGPTLTMPTVFDTKSAFPRSHSSPHIPDLVNVDYAEPTKKPEVELPRSASFTCIPDVHENTQLDDSKGLNRGATLNIPLNDAAQEERSEVVNGNMDNRLSKEEQPKPERLGRRKSLVARTKSWSQKVKGSPKRQESSEQVNFTPKDAPPIPSIPTIAKPKGDKTKTVSESFATFARKSWISTSRSPSPARNKGQNTGTDAEIELSSKTSSTASPANSIPTFEKTPPASVAESPPKSTRKPSTMLRLRPQSVLIRSSSSNNSSNSSLPQSSMDERSTPRTSTDKVPPLPTTIPGEELQVPINDKPQRRDELWSAFRSLENDFSNFQSKTWSLKTNVVRATLLPFLRSHAKHPSNKNLRPEDLDRRVNILKKWWVGLLEVLDGRNNQTVSGVDRPVLLEATTMIMTRPEWRTAPSKFAPLAERSPSRSPERGFPREKSSVSLDSSSLQFLTESVHHNVRNFFIQNILSQMSFVVDKMSLRHAPASLVTFCGKAAAYAFFFVPGIAEILVRVWKLQAEDLRRVADELGLPRRLNKLDMDEIVAKFPSHVHCLGWTSVNTMARELRKSPVLSILASKISWYGPWVARWCGRDSDLFYVFVKHYHILAEDFMPSGLTLVSKARAPGFILVQAQVLAALDATIHRQPAAEPPPITFDDVLAGADASAAALPLPSSNSSRLMAENRLIILLRDFMSERSSEFELARMTSVESFAKMMQAAARKTSLYNHSSCFVLCDFMEEALTLFVRFHHANALDIDFVDWGFWLDVCKKMLESQNSMSDIRLFAFIYTTWSVITNDERRKETICLDWLLFDEIFNNFFNHWCPMVRAYYMRLLCWRICRDNEEATDLDTKIFAVVSTRLKAVWAHYLFLKQKAERSLTLPPSTTPCLPAPGRRLLISRNDNQAPSPSLFLDFDGLMSSSPTSSSQSTLYERHSSLTNLSKLDTQNADPKLSTDQPTTPSKKRWTFINRVLPVAFSTSLDSSASPTPTSTKSTSPSKTLEEARRDTAIARSRPSMHIKTPSNDSDTPPSTAAHRAFCFKFSLEWTQHFEKAQSLPPSQSQSPNSNGASRGNGYPYNNERRLYPPRLPAPAQSWLGARVPGASREVGPRDPASDGEGSVNRSKGGESSAVEKMSRAKYAGRALAEWALVVAECNHFVDKRRAEGVPSLRWVEVPTLGMEGFRRFG